MYAQAESDGLVPAQAFRRCKAFAAYLVDQKGIEEEAPFFTYAWEIAFEVESPEDIDEATDEIAAQLNATANNVEGLQADEKVRTMRREALLWARRQSVS